MLKLFYRPPRGIRSVTVVFPLEFGPVGFGCYESSSVNSSEFEDPWSFHRVLIVNEIVFLIRFDVSD